MSFAPHDTPWASPGACAAAGRLASEYGARLPSTDRRDRARALAWVSDENRRARIERCGWMELCYHPNTGRVGWRHRWCRDRACPGCARRRSNEAKAKMRAHLVEREAAGKGALRFVTLTHPKYDARAEGPGEAVSRLLAEWRKLTNRRPFKRMVAGYVRAVECVWSPKGWRKTPRGKYFVPYDGWHAHLHLVLELAPGVDERDAEATTIGLWREIAGASAPALDWQELTECKVGQVAKYISKPFELPDDRAPAFFDAMKGRQLIAGSGTWRHWSAHELDGIEDGWCPQGDHVAELVDAAAKGRKWTMRWVETPEGSRPLPPWRKLLAEEILVERERPAVEWLDVLCANPHALNGPKARERKRAALDPDETVAALPTRTGDRAVSDGERRPDPCPSPPA